MTEGEIKQDILNHMNGAGGPLNSWYVGIASNPTDRLFKQHGVSEQGGQWIYSPADSQTVARNVEAHFLALGYDGGGGGGDASTTHVYAYKKTSGTKP